MIGKIIAWAFLLIGLAGFATALYVDFQIASLIFMSGMCIRSGKIISDRIGYD